MPDTLYFKFFSRNGYTELHVSRDRKEAEQGKALSKRIPHTSPSHDAVVQEMKNEVEFWLNDAKTAKELPSEGFAEQEKPRRSNVVRRGKKSLTKRNHK